MRLYRLERTHVVPQILEKVFAFFTDAGNLELLTPEFLHFRMLTPLPMHMEPGALIEYRLQLLSIPFYWCTRIETFEPGRRFSDIQLAGPYRHWHHLHEFSEVPDGTLMHDTVDYALPLGPLGTLAHVVFVRRTLERIFDYRCARIEQLLGTERKRSS